MSYVKCDQCIGSRDGLSVTSVKKNTNVEFIPFMSVKLNTCVYFMSEICQIQELSDMM